VILRFVPYIGPIIAAVLPATLAAAVSPHWSMVWTLGLFAVAELVTGQFIEPMVYGFDGTLAGCRRYRGDLLVLVVGAARPDHVDAADVMPRRTGAARRPPGVPRRTAWGSTSADADRKLLPTHASDDLDEALQQAELLKRSPGLR
jgi:hypothetical protein